MQKIKGFLVSPILVWEVLLLYLLFAIFFCVTSYREQNRIVNSFSQEIWQRDSIEREMTRKFQIEIDSMRSWLEQKQATKKDITSDSLTNKFKKRWKTNRN